MTAGNDLRESSSRLVSFSFVSCVFFLPDLDPARLPGYKLLLIVFAWSPFHDFVRFSSRPFGSFPVSSIQVQVVFQHPVINKLFAITVEGGPRK